MKFLKCDVIVTDLSKQRGEQNVRTLSDVTEPDARRRWVETNLGFALKP